MMKNVKNNEFLDLRFFLTEEMNNMMLELLITQQMSKENKLSKKDRQLLENHKNEVMLQFRKEFQKKLIKDFKKYLFAISLFTLISIFSFISIRLLLNIFLSSFL